MRQDTDACLGGYLLQYRTGRCSVLQCVAVCCITVSYWKMRCTQKWGQRREKQESSNCNFYVVSLKILKAFIVIDDAAQKLMTGSLDGKLVDNFIHEYDVMSLQDPSTCVCVALFYYVTSLKDSFLFCYDVPHKAVKRHPLSNPCGIFDIFSTLSLCSCSLRHRV